MSQQRLRVERLGEAHDLSSLDCGVESLDRWLRQSARVAAGAGTASTYVLCETSR
ncbi:MAG: hypothetical protein ACR2LK_14920 [Solirubrobacteraceae bacterium]